MKALVTGAGGFIGAAVVARAPQVVDELRVLLGPTDDPAGVPPELARVQCDIAAVDSWAALARDIDVVIHLAGPASVATSFQEAPEFLRAHVLGTDAALRVAVDAGVARFVHASSAEVYGAPDANPVPESAPMRPRSPYGAAKVGAEALVGSTSRTTGLDAVVLRPFSVFGPGMRRSSLFGTILDQVTLGGGVTLHDPSSIRDHCYVDDVADAFWRAATLAASPTVRTFNVATGTGIAAGALAEVALRVADRPGAVAARDDADRPVAAAIGELVADVDRARRDLGWHATTTLADGLQHTLAAFASAPGSGPAPAGIRR